MSTAKSAIDYADSGAYDCVVGKKAISVFEIFKQELDLGNQNYIHLEKGWSVITFSTNLIVILITIIHILFFQ